MGYNHRNDEIRDNVTRMRSEWEAQRDALATPRPKAIRDSGPRSPLRSLQSIIGRSSTATVVEPWWT
jgi:hypothetical protein